MPLIKALKKKITPKRIRRLLNWYGPYLGAAVKVDFISEDWKSVRVSMRQSWFNTNAVGTHFGGSLYSMIDPHYMLMLMNLLGKDYIIWDKSAYIDFIKPGKGTVTASFVLTDQDVETIREATKNGDKHLPEYKVEIIDAEGNVVAKARKVLYVRKK